MGVTAVSARRTPGGHRALRPGAGLRSRSLHDRVLALQRTAGNRAVAQLARQATSETDAPTLPRLTPNLRLPPSAVCLQDKTIQSAERVAGDPESRKVTLTDGSVYRVKRKRRVEFSDQYIPQPVTLSGHSDADRVWAQLDWCRSSHGRIQLGANPQQAGNEALKAIENTISRGGSVKEALEAASNTNVKPFLTFDIGQSKAWNVSGNVEVTLNREGVRGVTGSADVYAGKIHLKGTFTSDDTGKSGGFTIVFGDSPPSVKCKDKQRLYMRQFTSYEWTPWVPEHDERIKVGGTRRIPSRHYVYFDYAKPVVNTKLSETPRKQLLDEMRLGGEVTSITAHTSPEGSHDAQGKAWMGNTKLADERAAAAERWVRDVITEAKAGSIREKAKVEKAEEPELYTLREPETGRDIEGRQLEEHSEAMFGISDEEDRHRQEVDEELKQGPKRGRARAEAVYKRLRRAEIEVVRTEAWVDERVKKVEGAWRATPAICSPVPDAEIAKEYPKFDFT